MVSTIVHFALLGVLILIPLIYTEQLEAARLDDADGAAAAATATTTAAAPTVQSKPVPVKVVQIDPGTIVAPTEIPKEIAHIVEDAPTGRRRRRCRWSHRWNRRRVVGGVLGGVLTERTEGRLPRRPAAAAAAAATAAAATTARWW